MSFGEERQRFHVNINDDNYFVSWKKLQRTIAKADNSPPAGAKPALEARLAPVGAGSAAPEGQGRLDSVIEKIERMYKGGGDDSDEEDLSAAPHCDDYNTDDSFIDDESLDEYFEVDTARTKYTGFFINKGDIEFDQSNASNGVKRKRKDPSKGSKKPKLIGYDKTEPIPKKSSKPAPKAASPKLLTYASPDDGVPEVKKSGSLSIDVPGVKPSKYAAQAPKDASPSKHVERTIQELEKLVDEFIAKHQEAAKVQEGDQEPQQNSLKNKRLPPEVKSKLAKVARLAGKVTEELLERLMRSVGRFMQVKTLKKNLKEMIELGVTAKTEKQCKVGNFKEEIKEMVNSRISLSQAANESTGGVREAGDANDGELRRRYSWDEAVEDRICEFYDFYVEGMDEHKGAPSRKFYTEVAELWPPGLMDNCGIKSAVMRARDRKKGAMRRAKLEERKEEKKRKKSEVSARDTMKLLPCSASGSPKQLMQVKQEAGNSRDGDATTSSGFGYRPWDHQPPASEALLSSSLRKIKKELSKASPAPGNGGSNTTCLSWQQQQLVPEPSC